MLFIQGFDKSSLDKSTTSLYSAFAGRLQASQQTYNETDNTLAALEQQTIALESQIDMIRKNAERDFKDITEDVTNFCTGTNGFNIQDVQDLLGEIDRDIIQIKDNRDKINNYKKDPDTTPNTDARQCGTCDACNSCNTDCQTCDSCQSSYRDIANACGTSYEACQNTGSCTGGSYGYVIGCGSGQGCGECNWNDDIPPVLPGCDTCDANYVVCTGCNSYYAGCTELNESGNCKSNNKAGWCESRNSVNDCSRSNNTGSCYSSNDAYEGCLSGDTSGLYGCYRYNTTGYCFTENNYNNCIQYNTMSKCVSIDWPMYCNTGNDLSFADWTYMRSSGYIGPCTNCDRCDSCNSYCNSSNSGCPTCYIGCYAGCYTGDASWCVRDYLTCSTICNNYYDNYVTHMCCETTNAGCCEATNSGFACSSKNQYTADYSGSCKWDNNYGFCIFYNQCKETNNDQNYCLLADTEKGITYEEAYVLANQTAFACVAGNNEFGPYACVQHNLSGHCIQLNYIGHCMWANIADEDVDFGES